MNAERLARYLTPPAPWLWGAAAFAIVTWACAVLNPAFATAAFAYLAIVVLLALLGDFVWSAVFSVAAFFCLNYFFVTARFTFQVNSADDLVASFVFLATSFAIAGFVKYRSLLADRQQGRTRLLEAASAQHTEVELRRTQAELAHLMRISALADLTASIAHEVNQPLGAITMNGEACLRWLARDNPQLDEAREAAQRMIGDATRAGEIVGRIRALIVKAEPQKHPLDLNDVVGEVIPLIRQQAQSKGIALRLDLAPVLPTVLGDRVQLQQVLINLVINGIDAIGGREGGPRELTIRSHRNGGGPVLSVRNTGAAIDPEHVERVFEPFFTTRPHGMGLGLPVCRSIVEAHGGKVWASSDEGGTIFQFNLPACRGSAQHDLTQLNSRSALGFLHHAGGGRAGGAIRAVRGIRYGASHRR